MTNKDEIAELKARVAELERANKPPVFKSEPYQRYDPTAGMSMPKSTMLEMAAAVPDMREIAMRDNRAPTGPSSQGVVSSSQMVSNVRGSGWAREIPIGPPPGVNYADRLMDAQDAKDRHERIAQDAQLKGDAETGGGQIMTERTYEQIAAAQLRKEAEALENNSQATGQAMLDRYWQSKLDLEAEHRRMMRELNPTGLRIWT
jgi:hypothetical protein